MHFKFAPILFCLVAVLITNAQIKSDDLVPFRKGKKCGYSDINKNIIIKPKFDEAYPFSEGLGPVRKKKNWGAIDSTGKVIIPFQFESIGKFQSGMAIVYLNGLTGIINRSGKFTVAAKYKSINFLPYEYSIAQDTTGKEFLFDKNGKLIISEVVFESRIQMGRYLEYEEAVRFKLEKQEIDSLLQMTDASTLPEKYDELTNGYSLMNLIGIYDLKEGKILLPALFEDFDLSVNIGQFTEEKQKELLRKMETDEDLSEEFTRNLYFFVSGPRGDGLYSFTGKEIIPPVYNYIEEADLFSSGVTIVRNASGSHLIDLNGKLRTTRPYDEIAGDADVDQWFLYRKGDKAGIIDVNGKEITPPIFSEIEIAGTRALAQLDSTIMYITNTMTGVSTSDLKTYEEFGDLYDLEQYGVMIVRSKNKYGVIDSTGKEILPVKFDEVNMNGGFIVAKEGKSDRSFDITGKEIKLKAGSRLICAADKNKKSFIVQRPEGLGLENGNKFTLLKKSKPVSEAFCYKQIVGDSMYSWIYVGEAAGMIVSTNDKAYIAVPFKYYIDQYNAYRMPVIDTASQLSGIYSLKGKLIAPVKFASCEDGLNSYEKEYANFVVCGNENECVVYNGDNRIVYQGNHAVSNIELLNESVEDIVMGIAAGNEFKVFDRATKKFKPFKLKQYQLGETENFVLMQDSSDLWCVANNSFEPLTPFKYKELQQVFFDEVKGRYIMLYKSEDKKFGMVDEKGKEITPGIYESIEAGYSYNLSLVRQNGKSGMVDLNGKLIIPIEFTTNIEHIYDDIIAAVDADGFTAIYDMDGNCLLKRGLYKEVQLLARGNIAGRSFIYVEVPEGDGYVRFFIDSSGNSYYEK